jgi:hypothetical protein
VNPSPNDSILVGTINSPHLPPLIVGHLEKPKLSLRSNLEHLSLSLRSKPWILVLERRFELSFEWATRFKQEHFTLSLDDLDCICCSWGFDPLDGYVSPRSSQGLWLSPKKFVLPSSSWGLIVKNWVGLGGNLGGLGLKETRPFVNSSTEMQTTFVVSQTLGINLVSPYASCDLLSTAYLLFFTFLSSRSRVAQLSLF